MRKLYKINKATAQTLRDSKTAPVMLYAFEGFVDAGIAAGLAIGDFVNQEDTQRLVTFNADELLDYRSHRPPMTLSREGWSDYHQPGLGIDLVHDAAGSPFLLMYGPEPDLRWEAFTDAVLEVAKTFGVRQAVGMHGMPSSSPHTRDWRVTGAADGAELVNRLGGSPAAKIQMPGSAMALTELKLAQAGVESQTIVVHVPHYLGQMPSPMGAARLMREVGSATGLRFDLTGVDEAAEVQRTQLDAQVREQPELAAAISQMEEQHDSRRLARSGLELSTEALPSGEEIAAELEAFLASQGTPDDPDAFTV
jgi:hypothetical protein